MEDLMCRILVSVTSQSICIITSNSLSLMMLSVKAAKKEGLLFIDASVNIVIATV